MSDSTNNSENQDTNQSPPRRGVEALKHHIIAHKVDVALWCTRVITLILAFGYFIPIFGNRYSAYYKVLLANAAVSALRLHQRLPRVQFTRQFLAELIIEDSCHYLFYSLIFLHVSPVGLVLIPVVLFALLHSSSYSLTLLDTLGQNSWWGARLLISIVEFQSRNILRAISFMEIFLMPYSVILVLIYDVPQPKNDTEILFEKYIERYNKTYKENNLLRVKKFRLFQNAIKVAEELNSERAKNLSAIFGITKFSDMSQEEFIKKYLQPDMYSRIQKSAKLYRKNPINDNSIQVNRVRRLAKNIPPRVDWRNKQVVTKVNNQKNCGACWAFSTVETIESMAAIKHGKLDQLSVQELIDCAGYMNDGCNGGDICTLLYWLYDNNIKVIKEDEYPFHWQTETCKLNKTLSGVQLSDFDCTSVVGQEDLILSKLAYQGPVAVAVNAILWQHYVGGVIHYHCDGAPSLMNHAVQLVGYDTSADIPYYIVRNSWGKDFGENGYLYLAIGSNICGLANEVATLTVL